MTMLATRPATKLGREKDSTSTPRAAELWTEPAVQLRALKGGGEAEAGQRARYRSYRRASLGGA